MQGWEAKLREGLDRAREWWSDLDSDQQQLVATGGVLVLLALLESQKRARPRESIIRLKVEL
jgi:hypothetical protein